MNATAVAVPARSGSGPRVGATGRGPTPPTGPRLLLPPPAEPRAVPLSVSVEQAVALRTCSVLSPLTEQHWPFAARSTPPPPDLPDPAQLCGAVVLAAVEALRSARPLTQLARWVSPEVFESLARAAAPPAHAERHQRAVVRGLRVCRISRTVAEGSVVIHDGPRVRAAALRMEAHRGSWRVTVLHIG